MSTSTLTKSVTQQVAEATCDRCGARARSRARLAQHELFLCRHHTIEHASAMTKSGWSVIMPTDGDK